MDIVGLIHFDENSAWFAFDLGTNLAQIEFDITVYTETRPSRGGGGTHLTRTFGFPRESGVGKMRFFLFIRSELEQNIV